MTRRDDRCEDCDRPRADRVLSEAERAAVPGGGRGMSKAWAEIDAILDVWRERDRLYQQRADADPSDKWATAIAEANRVAVGEVETIRARLDATRTTARR